MGGRVGARLGQGECHRAPSSLRRQQPPPRELATTTPPTNRVWRPAVAAAVAGTAHRRRQPRDAPCRLGVDDARQGYGRLGGIHRSRRAAAAHRRRERRRRRPRGARTTRSSPPRRRWATNHPPAAGAARPAMVAAAADAVAWIFSGPPTAAVVVAVPAAGAQRGWRRAPTAAFAAAAAAAAAAADWWRRLGATDGFQVCPECGDRLLCAGGRRRLRGGATYAVRAARGTGAVPLRGRPRRKRSPATAATCRRRHAGGGTRPDSGPASLPPALSGEEWIQMTWADLWRWT